MIRLIGLAEDLIGAAVDEIVQSKSGTGAADFSDTVVVFPSQRIGFFLKDRLSRRLGKNYFPPRMLTADQFFNALFDANCPGYELIGDLEGSLFLFRALKEVFPDTPLYGGGDPTHFPGFFPWALKILRAVEETMVEGAAFADLNPDIFRDFVRYGDYHREYRQFIMELPRLVQVFSQLLKERRKASRGLIYQTAAGLAETEELKLPAGSSAGTRLLFLGFFALNRCEEQVFRTIFAHHQAHMIVRTDAAALKDPASPFYLQNRTLKALAAEIVVEGDPADRPRWNELARKVKLYASSNRETMMARVYEVLREIIQSKKSAEELLGIGVVLPDAAALIPFVQGVVSRFDMEQANVPFNITLGYPFARTPLFQVIDLMLQVGESRKGEQIFSPDYLNLIRHPYVKLSAPQTGGEDVVTWAIHILEDMLSRQNLLYFSPAELADLMNRHLAGRDDIDGENAAKIRQAVLHIHQTFLTAVDIPFARVCRSIRQAVLAIEKNRRGHLFLQEYIAAGLGELDRLITFAGANEGEFSGADFQSSAAFIRYYLSRTDIHFRGSPLKGIQVMGMLEFRGLTFDDVIVLDAVEGVLPQSSAYDPLLPYDIRRTLGIRVYSDWEQLYAFNFFSLIGGSVQSHVFWPERQGFDRGQRSRFIERIVYEIEKERGTVEHPNLVQYRLDFSPAAQKLKQVEKNEKIKERIAGMQLSPSSLETYMLCPLRFYFERVQRLAEREAISADPDASEFGHIVHDTLKEWYKQDIHRTGEVLKAGLREAVRQQFSERGFKQLSGINKIRLWLLVEKLTEFLQFDQRRMSDGGVRVVNLEEEAGYVLTVDGIEGGVSVTGRIDRIEQQGQITRILDYKTGSDFTVKVSDKHGTLIMEDLWRLPAADYLDSLRTLAKTYKNFQILLYALIYNETKIRDYEKVDAAYMFLRSPHTFFKEVFVKGRTDTPLEPAEKERIMACFTANLHQLIRDIHLRHTFIANPADEHYCSYCPFRIPCGNI